MADRLRQLYDRYDWCEYFQFLHIVQFSGLGRQTCISWLVAFGIIMQRVSYAKFYGPDALPDANQYNQH